ncbi:hypothetical protein [Actinomyces ruminicola]|uniref:Lipoprotein n=1 Tax=Actinomyces ruminicola TaxID=332524 RepID=A0A1G9ZIC1_9ACTO|nr:hypothetical protein [Actinomyces ruminicola]SDN21120.1 hypothetical protein SAMN04487766_1185 [Actinomyces ruminicola]
MRRFPADTPGFRRTAAGAVALLLACAPVVACSSDSNDNPLGIGTYDPEAMASADASESAAAAASASAAASAEAAGVVTAESLSTERHVITSIPEDLDEQQTEILKAFVHYDEVTWNIWFTRTGIEEAQPLMVADEYQAFTDYFEENAAGRTDGTVRVAVTSVYLTAPDAVPPRAVVEVCDDQTDLVDYDADGNDVSDPETLQVRYKIRVTMVYEDGTWKEASEERLSTNECTV